MKERIQKLVKATFAAATIALAATSFSAHAFTYQYAGDGWGNHILVVQNTSWNSMLYCQIRGSNGTWGNASIPPGAVNRFHIWGATSSAWNCWYN